MNMSHDFEIDISILFKLYLTIWILVKFVLNERPVVAQGQSDCKIDWLWVRSPLEEMKYLLKFIFLFLRSGIEDKRCVEFCHLTRNTSKVRQKVRTGVSLH